jgi:hypothetical protein
VTPGFANELHAAANLEFCQQGRNVEFDGSLREVEVGSNFFVGETIRNAGKDLFFAACEPHLAVNGLTGFEQLVGFLNQVFQDCVLGLDQNSVVTWTLPPDKAMHGEQPGRLIHGETAIGAGLDVEMGNSRILFVEEKRIAAGYGTSG